MNKIIVTLVFFIAIASQAQIENDAAQVELEAARVMLNQAATLSSLKEIYIDEAGNISYDIELQNYQDAIIIYDDLINRFGDSKYLEIQTIVANAMLYKSAALSFLDRNEESNDILDAVIERFKNNSDTGIQVIVSEAIINKGFGLDELDRHEEAIATFDELVERFKDSNNESIQSNVAISRDVKKKILEKLAREK